MGTLPRKGATCSEQTAHAHACVLGTHFVSVISRMRVGDSLCFWYLLTCFQHLMKKLLGDVVQPQPLLQNTEQRKVIRKNTWYSFVSGICESRSCKTGILGSIVSRLAPCFTHSSLEKIWVEKRANSRTTSQSDKQSRSLQQQQGATKKEKKTPSFYAVNKSACQCLCRRQ